MRRGIISIIIISVHAFHIEDKRALRVWCSGKLVYTTLVCKQYYIPCVCMCI